MLKQKKKKCAVYARVSTKMQANKEHNSCESQMSRIQSFVKSREDMEIVDYYSDEGYSGSSINRPKLQELLNDVKLGKIDVVISYKIDRLSRNPRNFYFMIDLFDKCSVEYISITEMFDTSSASGRLLRNIMLVFAEFERELISERTKHKLEERAKMGFWNGGYAPLGYECRNKKLLLIKEDARIVKMIFEKFLENQSINKICEILKKERTGFVEKKIFDEIDERIWNELVARKIIRENGQITGNRIVWDENFLELGTDISKTIRRILEVNKLIKPARIKTILNNLVYTGKIIFKGQIIDGAHERIIEDEVFETIKTLQKTKNKKFKLYKNLVFGGLVKCRECGTTMTKSYSNKKTNDGKLKRYFYYRCSSTSGFEPRACSIRQVSAEKLRWAIVENLERIVGDEMYLENLALRMNFEEQKKFEKKTDFDMGREPSSQTFSSENLADKKIVTGERKNFELCHTCTFF